MNRILFLLNIILLIILASCTTDVQVNAPKRDLPIVYLIINPDDSLHIARITKGFQSENNALITAKDSSASEYLPNEIKVELFEETTRGTFLIGELNRQLNTQKQPGLFYAPNQIVYQIKTNELKAKQGSNYQLKITNQTTDKTYETIKPVGLVGNFTIFAPVSGTAINYRVNYDIKWGEFLNNTFTKPLNSQMYEIKAVVNYIEVDDEGNESSKSFEWLLSPNITAINNEQLQTYTIKANSFFDVLVANIDTSNNTPFLTRKLGPITYYISAASTEFADYIEISSNVSAISQIKPIYSNIKEGIGLVASRRTNTTQTVVAAATKIYLQQNYKSLRIE